MSGLLEIGQLNNPEAEVATEYQRLTNAFEYKLTSSRTFAEALRKSGLLGFAEKYDAWSLLATDMPHDRGVVNKLLGVRNVTNKLTNNEFDFLSIYILSNNQNTRGSLPPFRDSFVENYLEGLAKDPGLMMRFPLLTQRLVYSDARYQDLAISYFKSVGVEPLPLYSSSLNDRTFPRDTELCPRSEPIYIEAAVSRLAQEINPKYKLKPIKLPSMETVGYYKEQLRVVFFTQPLLVEVLNQARLVLADVLFYVKDNGNLSMARSLITGKIPVQNFVDFSLPSELQKLTLEELLRKATEVPSSYDATIPQTI